MESGDRRNPEVSRSPAASKALAAVDKASPDDETSDGSLVERCLSQDVAAWEEMYARHHRPMCDAITAMLGSGRADASLVDEIAARVWYALVSDGGQLLIRFDPRRSSRLSPFLRGLARVEIMRYLRRERRQREIELLRGERSSHEAPMPFAQWNAILRDFTATLTPSERRFVEEYLLARPQSFSPQSRQGLSEASIWQHRHRIRSKLRAFLGSE